MTEIIKCLNCGLCLNKMWRCLILELDTTIISILAQWLSPAPRKWKRTRRMKKHARPVVVDQARRHSDYFTSSSSARGMACSPACKSGWRCTYYLIFKKIIFKKIDLKVRRRKSYRLASHILIFLIKASFGSL